MKASRARGSQISRTTKRTGITESVRRPSCQSSAQHHADDAEEQRDVADREHRGLEELLHRVDVALQPRHQPADLGLVHERQRDALQVGEHRPAHVEEHVLGRLADHGLLHVARGVVDEDRRRRRRRRTRRAPLGARRPAAMPRSMAWRMISGMRSWVRGEDQDRRDRDQHLPSGRGARSPRSAGRSGRRRRGRRSPPRSACEPTTARGGRPPRSAGGSRAAGLGLLAHHAATCRRRAGAAGRGARGSGRRARGAPSCVPLSTTAPSSRNRMRSACISEPSRCAMMIVTRSRL